MLILIISTSISIARKKTVGNTGTIETAGVDEDNQYPETNLAQFLYI